MVPSAAEPSCGWPVSFNITNSKLLILDSSAAYWDQPIVAGPGVRITISGTYPDASYFSLQTYTPYATPFSVNGVSSSLADYQVAPGQGSTNPWQHRAAPGGRFQVTVRSGVAPGEPNVLPLPSGTSVAHPGYLVYRVYLPAGGSLSHLTPPTVTWAQGSVSRTLPACSTHEPLPAPEKAPTGTTPGPKTVPPAGAFFKPYITKYKGRLADANDAYVWAYVIRPAATDVLVVTAKAPTSAPGGGPSPWPAASEDMQYWSMCIGVGSGTLPTVVNQLPGGQVDYGCRADQQTKLNATGGYTYVIGSEAQRAAISKVPGATFLPFSSTQTTRLVPPPVAQYPCQPRLRPFGPEGRTGRRRASRGGRHGALLPERVAVPPRHAHDQRAQRLRNPLETSVPGPRPPSPGTPGQPVRDARPAAPSGPGSSERPALVVEHLSKRFGRRVAFDDVSFQVGSGEVFGFLGPNGAGKTTTVRTLGTLLAPSSGSATVAGIELHPANGPAIRSRISVMPESPGLYLRLTVGENLQCFAKLYELADARTRIERALQAVNLTERANDLCRALSKGLRQRVALARALLNDPAVLFLDEPTSGLDPVATREVHELIAALKDRGVTIFLTTHRLEEAERLCDRVAILNTTMRLVGRPDELRAQLFKRSLEVRLRAELADPAPVFAGLPGVQGWEASAPSSYLLTVPDPDAAAPEVARALVHAGADILSITEPRHSLEDVYLQLVDEDVEAKRR